MAMNVGGDVEARNFGGERRIGEERHQGRWQELRTACRRWESLARAAGRRARADGHG